MCGDSNQVLYPILDKSPTPPTIHRPSYQNLLNQHFSIDTWREQHPRKRQYTHYSHPYKQFSCIDHLLVNINSSPLILNSQIILCAWSDHNATLTTFSSLIPKPNYRIWNINDSLLATPTYRQNIEKAIQEYITNNTLTDISPLMLWEAYKPTIK